MYIHGCVHGHAHVLVRANADVCMQAQNAKLAAVTRTDEVEHDDENDALEEHKQDRRRCASPLRVVKVPEHHAEHHEHNREECGVLLLICRANVWHARNAEGRSEAREHVSQGTPSVWFWSGEERCKLS